MARLTYQDADGSVSWDQLAALLRDLEARIETETGDAPAEMKEGGASSWLKQRFVRVT